MLNAHVPWPRRCCTGRSADGASAISSWTTPNRVYALHRRASRRAIWRASMPPMATATAWWPMPSSSSTSINPQVAARMATGFRSWQAVEFESRKIGSARRNCDRVLAEPNLSRDVLRNHFEDRCAPEVRLQCIWTNHPCLRINSAVIRCVAGVSDAFRTSFLPCGRAAKEDILGKTHDRRTVFQGARACRLPSPLPGRFSDHAFRSRHLRRLIIVSDRAVPAGAGSALLVAARCTAAARIWPSRTAYRLLHGQLAAQRIKADFAQAALAGETPPVHERRTTCGKSLPADALAEERVFAVADSFGQDHPRSLPAAELLDGKPITDVLSPNFVTDACRCNGDDDARRCCWHRAKQAFVSMHDLGTFPGSLIVFQRERTCCRPGARACTQSTTAVSSSPRSCSSCWRAAFHWQAAQGGGGRRRFWRSPPNASTRRWIAASAACGTGTSPRAPSSGRRSMFEILGMPVKGDFLSFAEVAERLHPDDAQLEELIEELLDGADTCLRPGIPHAP